MMFLGLDLAWRSDPYPLSTGACLIDSGGEVVLLGLVTTNEEILSLLDKDNQMWVGIDAPLCVPNLTGMRRCERIMMRMGLPCLPSNQRFMERHFGGRRGEDLARALRGRGFVPASPEVRGEKVYFEVYPSGALRILCGKIPSYKRGRLCDRRKALEQVIEAMDSWHSPPDLCLSLRQEIENMKLHRIKGLCDILDAALAAACLYCHYIKNGKNTQLLGDVEHGYVLLPTERNMHDG
ncbi:MAG: DUF429 domain-containing protein [Methanomassiliicoccales archaeon]